MEKLPVACLSNAIIVRQLQAFASSFAAYCEACSVHSTIYFVACCNIPERTCGTLLCDCCPRSNLHLAMEPQCSASDVSLGHWSTGNVDQWLHRCQRSNWAGDRQVLSVNLGHPHWTRKHMILATVIQHVHFPMSAHISVELLGIRSVQEPCPCILRSSL